MSEFTPPTTEIIEISDAFQMWTHFLNPKGLSNHHIGGINEPLIATQPQSIHDEIAWTHIEHFVSINLVVGGESETMTSARRHYGDKMLTTGLDIDGHYQFTPLAELVEAEQLPIYTAGWLARYVKTWNRNRLTGEPTYPVEFSLLKDKSPFNTLLEPDEVKILFPVKNDHRSQSELKGIAYDERARRMASLVLQSYPHLDPWYRERDIPVQDELTDRRVLSVLASR